MVAGGLLASIVLVVSLWVFDVVLVQVEFAVRWLG
jgi:hypothetical protein